MDSCFVLVDGVRTHYWKAGSGPPLVMVHGLVADGRNWELNVPALAPYRTVYAVDMVNMGRSAHIPGAPAGLSAIADWLSRFMDAVGVAQADLAGSSHGGAVCLAFAARHTGRARSLMLFGPANPFCERPRLLIRFWSSPLGRLAAWTLPYMPRYVVDQAHRRAYGDPAAAPDCMLDGYREGLNHRSINHLLRIVDTWWEDMAELKQSLTQAARVPALLVWGELDFIVGVESGKLLRNALDARLIVVPGVGHLPFVEAVESSNRVMLDWLRD